MIRALLRKNGIEPCIASTIQNAVSQMMTRTFDVVALDTETEDAARLIVCCWISGTQRIRFYFCSQSVILMFGRLL